MNVTEQTSKILTELSNNLKYIDNNSLINLITLIKSSNHIFLVGAGRSGLAIQGFTNRLLHLGFSVSYVGEISNPKAKEKDLLIIGSGSGETSSLVSMAKKAKEEGLNIALVTMDQESTLGKIADVSIVLPGSSPKLVKKNKDNHSIQPMATSFEQMAFLIYDSIILELMKDLNEDSETMFNRHANLE